MVIALMPLASAPQMVSYNTTILGYPYNYSHPVVYQVFQSHFCPIHAVLLLGAALLVLLRDKPDAVALAKPLFAAGVGPLGLALLRFVIFRPHIDDLVWFQLWEEVTELLFVTGVLCVVWVFRSRLFATGSVTAAAAGGAQPPT
jgi:hypothetical protein